MPTTIPWQGGEQVRVISDNCGRVSVFAKD